MPRPMQRMPLELGLRLDINQLLRDGLIESGQITPPKEYQWFGADGEAIASAKISANMTNVARYRTMRIVAPSTPAAIATTETVSAAACSRIASVKARSLLRRA